MKTIKVTYTEIQVVEFTKNIEVTESQFEQIQKGKIKAEDIIDINDLEQEAADHGSHYVESRTAQLELF